MDEFQFKSPAAATVSTNLGSGQPEAGDIQIMVLMIEGIWGTNGTAYDGTGVGIEIEPTLAAADDVVAFPDFFEDPSFG